MKLSPEQLKHHFFAEMENGLKAHSGKQRLNKERIGNGGKFSELYGTPFEEPMEIACRVGRGGRANRLFLSDRVVISTEREMIVFNRSDEHGKDTGAYFPAFTRQLREAGQKWPGDGVVLQGARARANFQLELKDTVRRADVEFVVSCRAGRAVEDFENIAFGESREVERKVRCADAFVFEIGENEQVVCLAGAEDAAW